MPKLIIRPSGQEIEVDKEKSILEILKEKDIYIKSSCGGVANCTDCKVKIVLGGDSLTSPPFEEIQLLGNVFHITNERLSCQTKICGDDQVVIDISGHDKEKDSEALKSKMKKGGPKKQVIIRKKISISESKEQRRSESAKKREDTKKKWFRTWDEDKEKSEDELALLSKISSGGNRRPRSFKTDDPEILENSENTTREEAGAFKRSPRDLFKERNKSQSTKPRRPFKKK